MNINKHLCAHIIYTQREREHKDGSENEVSRRHDLDMSDCLILNEIEM